jgi:c-di-GMP phosphodiesterase
MELYRRLVETAPDGILIVEDDRVMFANPAAVALAGATRPEDLLGN